MVVVGYGFREIERDKIQGRTWDEHIGVGEKKWKHFKCACGQAHQGMRITEQCGERIIVVQSGGDGVYSILHQEIRDSVKSEEFGLLSLLETTARYSPAALELTALPTPHQMVHIFHKLFGVVVLSMRKL
ncbi:hypothetical protein E3N88_19833 [Mikania micrantha]|uniref:Uncharacterized protein n=1 Tax=Mikania micrantha TaxID=192012 RepID=A0A5N6NSG1_9ASTR|nr:hypothetical protein E3N88_19833 [Mikania micrantha]